jgi:hypothetical protein
MRVPLARLFFLLACLAHPAVAQEPSVPSLGYRMDGLDLAVFDGLAGDAEPPLPPRSHPLHALPLARLSPSPEGTGPALRDEGSGHALGFAPFGPDTLEAAPEPEGVNAWRVAAVTGGATGAALFVMDHQRRRWWADRSPSFRVSNDWGYVRWADKLGHFYCGALLTRGYRGALRWAGLSEDQARLWGAVGGFTNMLFYEVLDGYGPQWGFSPGDLVFNTLGVFFAAAQADDPAFDAFDVKFSYWPSGWEGKNPIDDYAGQTYWLTGSPHRLAPDAAKRHLPPWLNVAVGYGARDRDAQDFLTTSLVYVGLDFEPAGLPFRGKVWDALVPVLRHVHFPGPAVRLTPDPAFVPFAY